MLINYKGKMSNLVLEKSHRHYLNEVIKVNIISNGTSVNHVPPDRMQ